VTFRKPLDSKCDCGNSTVLGSICSDCAATAIVDRLGRWSRPHTNTLHKQLAEALEDFGNPDVSRCSQRNAHGETVVARKTALLRIRKVVTHFFLASPHELGGLRVWCGRSSKEDYFATKPEAVTCSECIRSMRQASLDLAFWLEKLPPADPDTREAVVDGWVAYEPGMTTCDWCSNRARWEWGTGISRFYRCDKHVPRE
jgi:hypothetical protein